MKQISRMTVLPPEHIIRLPYSPAHPPLGSCLRQRNPDNLESMGYVEEEYIISGFSNVYLWPESESRPVVRVSGAPYTTRILVRKPSSPDSFSGVVCMENFNNSNRIDMSKVGWTICKDVIVQNGDAWVGYDVQKVGFRTLSEFDPDRYAPYHLAFNNPLPKEERGPLGWHVLREAFAKKGITPALEVPDDFEKGLMFDMSYQLAVLLRRCAPGDPLEGYSVKAVCGAAVADFNLYVAGFDPYFRRSDGGPVFDGYLKVMAGAGGEISREADAWQSDDPRSMVPAEVPFIKIETAGDMRDILPHPSMACKRRMQDLDLPDRKVCWYELAGIAVTFTERRDQDVRPCDDDLRWLKLPPLDPWPPCPYIPYAGIRLIEGAYANLRLWILNGVAPPHMKEPLHLEEKADGSVSFLLDSWGNHIGGVRSPYVDVPVASYSDDGSVKLLSPSLLTSLYTSPAEYARRVEEAAFRMLSERWILPAGVRQIVCQARTFRW